MLSYMVGLLIAPATTTRWTPLATSYGNCEIQDGVQWPPRLCVYTENTLTWYFFLDVTVKRLTQHG